MEYQRTIGKPVSYEGVGLHTGKPVAMRLSPAGAGRGIVFVRKDLPSSPEVEANLGSVISSSRRTVLGKDGVGDDDIRIETVEHVLSAFLGLGIDNVTVEVDSLEVPAGDGSAAPFVRLLEEAGIVTQEIPRYTRTLDVPVWVKEGHRCIVALPAGELRISFAFTSSHPAVRNQFAEFVISEPSFTREIAPARTFGFMNEVRKLHEAGLALGGSLETALVIGESGYVQAPRFPDEPVRHKILDLVGDLALIGPLRAHIIAIGSGHELNHRLGKTILEVSGC